MTTINADINGNIEIRRIDSRTSEVDIEITLIPISDNETAADGGVDVTLTVVTSPSGEIIWVDMPMYRDRPSVVKATLTLNKGVDTSHPIIVKIIVVHGTRVSGYHEQTI